MWDEPNRRIRQIRTYNCAITLYFFGFRAAWIANTPFFAMQVLIQLSFGTLRITATLAPHVAIRHRCHIQVASWEDWMKCATNGLLTSCVWRFGSREHGAD